MPSRSIDVKARAKTTRKKGAIRKVVANPRNSVILPKHLTRMLNICLDKAKQMLRVTTQRGIHTTVHPISRRYKTDHLHLTRKYISGRWYVDWMPTATKSIMQCKGVFVYSNRTFPEVYPKESKMSIKAAEMLQEFCEDVGISENIKSNRAPEFCAHDSPYLKLIKDKRFNLTYAEPEHCTEIYNLDITIKELKKHWHHKMSSKN